MIESLARTHSLPFWSSRCWRVAFAAGGGGGGGGGGGAAVVAAAGAAKPRVMADPDLTAGMAAVNAQQWDKAIARLNAYVHASRATPTPDGSLTRYRMTGDLDNAFKGYARALRIDPKHRNAHEYLGEADLQAGDLAGAEARVAHLDKLCFLPCEQ